MAKLAIDGAHATARANARAPRATSTHAAHAHLVRVRVVPPVDLHAREGVNVLSLAQLLAARGAVCLCHEDIVAIGLAHDVGIGLLPDGLQPPAPRAPRRVKVDHHQLARLYVLKEGGHIQLWRQLRRRVAALGGAEERLGMLDLARNGGRVAQNAAGRVHARFQDVRRHVLQVCAHDIGNVKRCESARQVVEGDVEVELQLLLV